jgi:hypothetical protein
MGEFGSCVTAFLPDSATVSHAGKGRRVFEIAASGRASKRLLKDANAMIS